MTDTYLGSSKLDAARRSAELKALGDDPAVDVLVIGAGITGTGIALDAASRGLRTVLVEKQDLAHGTSRWSSKLAHGGLRYLATGNVGIARRSAIERGILITKTAPYLVHSLAQLVPLVPAIGKKQELMIRAGFIAGDVLRAAAGTPSSLLPWSGKVDANRTLQFTPSVAQQGLRGGLLSWDGQLIDDARLVTAVARTAAEYGTKVLTRVEATDVTGDGAVLRDTISGETLDISARVVINAAGVWAGDVDSDIKLRPSRGTHLVFDAETLGNPTASFTIPIPGETNRFVFFMPEQLGRVYLGLTDEEAPGPIPDNPQPTDAEIDFLIKTANLELQVPLTRADIRGMYAGLRPLIDNGEGRTADVSREHAVLESNNGLFSIVGGKLTEYRYMAQDVLDQALAARHIQSGPMRTKDLPLVGAPGNPDTGLGSLAGLPDSMIARYGNEAAKVASAATVDRPLEQVAPGIDVTRAEFEFAVTHELALDASDILDRRTRIGLVQADRDLAAAAADEAMAGKK